MLSKSTTSQSISQPLIAGLIPGSGIEFFGIHETREVKWLQNGIVKPFSQLPPGAFMCLNNELNKNQKAKEILAEEADSLKRQVELFAYYYYGGIDSRPDMIDGQLQEPENYRHSLNCISLAFKPLKLNGNPLKPREIKMIDMYTSKEDPKEETVAQELGITRSTLDKHKNELYQKAGVFSKTGLLTAAFKARIPIFNRAQS